MSEILHCGVTRRPLTSAADFKASAPVACLRRECGRRSSEGLEPNVGPGIFKGLGSFSMRSITTLGAAVALAIASASALATTQADIPAQPVAGPTPNGNNGNGGLLVVAWDGTKSIAQYLGLELPRCREERPDHQRLERRPPRLRHAELVQLRQLVGRAVRGVRRGQPEGRHPRRADHHHGDDAWRPDPGIHRVLR